MSKLLDQLQSFARDKDFYFACESGEYLIKAARSNNIEAVKFLLKKGQKVHEEQNKPALSAAVQNGHINIVKFFINAGADIEFKDENYSASPLDFAAQYGYIDIVELLIDNGAKADSLDRN